MVYQKGEQNAKLITPPFSPFLFHQPRCWTPPATRASGCRAWEKREHNNGWGKGESAVFGRVFFPRWRFFLFPFFLSGVRGVCNQEGEAGIFLCFCKKGKKKTGGSIGRSSEWGEKKQPPALGRTPRPARHQRRRERSLASPHSARDSKKRIFSLGGDTRGWLKKNKNDLLWPLSLSLVSQCLCGLVNLEFLTSSSKGGGGEEGG